MEKPSVNTSYNISCVSYLNSRPFLYGLENSGLLNRAQLSLDLPSECAEKLLDGRADIGLVPVVLIPELENARIISDYCIGADGPVESVLLLSDVPLQDIEAVIPDPHSRTSVMLARVLADRYWNILPRWLDGDSHDTSIRTARVRIGDKTFGERKRYRYAYDLADEWKNFTSLPFVFACWVSTLPLPADFLTQFNNALSYGLGHREELCRNMAADFPGIDISDYLRRRISYDLDDRKRQAMQLFFKMALEVQTAYEQALFSGHVTATPGSPAKDL